MSKKNDFETSLLQLEEIVSKLESGNVTLDESIELYQKGVKLSEECNSMLNNAKLKIEYIKNENANNDTELNSEDKNDI